MAGYVLKIALENTHPPVWRRVLVPDKITFANLHEIIQILFGWENVHLHEFHIPSEDICIDDGEEAFGRYHYAESETTVDYFLENYKWIRYTYDFGDTWEHKIVCERTEEDFAQRTAVLLKAKGDNFAEDSGGVWNQEEDGGNRIAFEGEKTTLQLEKRQFPVSEASVENTDDLLSEEEYEKMLGFMKELADKMSGASEWHFNRYKKSNVVSPMAKKIESWKKFEEKWEKESGNEDTLENDYEQLTLPFIEKSDIAENKYVLEVSFGNRTVAEHLQDLGLQEAKDYCKYLQLPAETSETKNQMTDAVAGEFREHPEYILYVFFEEEFRKFLHMLNLAGENVRMKPEYLDVVIKALTVGLADLSIQKKKGKCRAVLTFASNTREILKPLNEKRCKEEYRNLERFWEKLAKLLGIYGFMELEQLYGMYKDIYHVTMDRTTFNRYVYWHTRFNNMAQTAYTDELKNYVAIPELDLEKALVDMRKYTKDMDYVRFPPAVIRKMTNDISERSDWFDTFFTVLHHQMEMPVEIAGEIIEGVFRAIISGEALDMIMETVYLLILEKPDLEERCDLWMCMTSLMLELELPMLKGRSRMQYAEEKGISPWQIGMLAHEENEYRKKECHMYEFPAAIQEAMHQAASFANTRDMDFLMQYKEKEHVKSEEFLYLLTDANITGCRFAEAEKLLGELEKSVGRNKDSILGLRERLDNGADVMDEEDEFGYEPWTDYEFDFEQVQQPFVRQTPKIGRNDPCPCGSGKKYKKCCGKNV